MSKKSRGWGETNKKKGGYKKKKKKVQENKKKMITESFNVKDRVLFLFVLFFFPTLCGAQRSTNFVWKKKGPNFLKFFLM